MMIAEADIIFLFSSEQTHTQAVPTDDLRKSLWLSQTHDLSRRISEQGCLSPTLVSLPILGRKLPKEALMVMEVRRSPCWCSLERNVWLLFVCLLPFPWQPPLSPTISKEHVLVGVSF